MKKLIGIFAICFVFSLSALAQHEGHQGGGRPEVGGGHQNIPSHGPSRVKTPAPAQENRQLVNGKVIQTLPTSITANDGLAMTPAATMPTTISIIRGSMAASRVVLAAATYGGSEAVARTGSGLADSSSQSLPTISGIATTGCGIPTKS